MVFKMQNFRASTYISQDCGDLELNVVILTFCNLEI